MEVFPALIIFITAGFWRTWTSTVKLDARRLCDILTTISVEADYTVVFFAAGGRHRPGWDWVWKAYRSLSRKYRKNLKRLVSSFHQTKTIIGRMWKEVATSHVSIYVPFFQPQISTLSAHV